MFLNTVFTFVEEEGVKDKNDCIAVKSSLYIKPRNSLLVELSDKYSNEWHTKQNTCFLPKFMSIYHKIRLSFSLCMWLAFNYILVAGVLFS